jgi:hypothetical protein
VAQKGTLTCPKPSGAFTPKRIGPLALGETRASARYVAPGHGSNYVFKVRHGVIQEIGIANKAKTSTRTKQKRFLASFKAK